MHAVLSGGRLRAATNCACRLSPELKARVRLRMLFQFDMGDVPKQATPPLIERMNLQVKNILSIQKRNQTLCPSIMYVAVSSLTKANELPFNEWMAYHNEADHMPSLEQLRKKCAELAWEYRKISHSTDAITAAWCVGYGLQDALEVHRRREQLIARGEHPNTAIFGSLSRNEEDIRILNWLSKILKLEPEWKLEHEAILELIQKHALAVELQIRFKIKD